MSYIFEYGAWVSVDGETKLKQSLKDIWEQQLFAFDKVDEMSNDVEFHYQPFLKFDGAKIRANNFVGFIQNGDELIEIYPKVFREQNCTDKSLMLRHVFFWFKYCRKWRFPFNQANLDNDEIDKFPELIIHLIANQIFDIISSQPFMQYQSVEETLTMPKGSVNFNRYVNRSIVKGKYHQIECDYEPFLFDNRVNRIIKYCARILMEQSQFKENIYLLQESLNILDEVSDVECSVADIISTSLNSFYQDYVLLMDTCKLVVNHQLYSNGNYDLSQWCLLFPMEYIFEDFVAGFFEKHFSEKWIVHYQKSDEYLSNEPKVFNMQHDIFLTSKVDSNRRIIIDTKYKIRNRSFKNENKKGIAQADLYQMVSYAYKRGCNEVFMLYPNVSENLNEPDIFRINSGFNGDDTINVTAMEVPFWSIENFTLLDEKLKVCLKKYF
jgi:5-methylcytosine-specific restriction enzyme subunit McrC